MSYSLLLLAFVLHAQNNPPCAAPAAPLDWAQLASVRYLADQVSPPDLTDIEDLLGTCDENTHDRETIIKQMRFKLSDVNAALGRKAGDADLVKGELPDVRKEDHSQATMSDLLAIDIVARTIYSEVGTQPNCGIRYVAALGGVIMNRADAVAKNENYRALWAPQGTNDINHPLADVVLSPGQFQVWKKKSNANRSAMCPASQLSQKYASLDTKGVAMSTGIGSNNQWVDCYSVAAYMVLREKQFRQITAGVTAVNYTSGDEEAASRPESCYKPVSMKMNGKTLPNNPKCMQFWNNPTPLEIKACKAKKAVKI